MVLHLSARRASTSPTRDRTVTVPGRGGRLPCHHGASPAARLTGCLYFTRTAAAVALTSPSGKATLTAVAAGPLCRSAYSSRLLPFLFIPVGCHTVPAHRPRTMQVPAGVVYTAFGVTILIAAVLLLRAVTSLRRHFLNFHEELEWPEADPGRRVSGSTETRLVLNGGALEGDDVPPPPRVSLPEWVGGGGEGAAKRVPPLSLAQLDKACPAAALTQSTAGGGGDAEGGGEEGSTGEAPPCSVCLDDMEPGQLVRTLPVCGHVYHDVYVWVGGRAAYLHRGVVWGDQELGASVFYFALWIADERVPVLSTP